MGRKIIIGYDEKQKKDFIKSLGDFKKVYEISTLKQSSDDGKVKIVSYDECINYVHYYELLHKLDDECLLIIDEPLHNTDRYNLNYNCVRGYTKKTKNVIIFSYLPILSSEKDFLILKDFNNPFLLKDNDFQNVGYVEIVERVPSFDYKLKYELTEEEQKKYEAKKDGLIENIGIKDPHTIPRELHKFVSNFKEKKAEEGVTYLVRAKRKIGDNTYRNAEKQASIVFEYPISKKDFINYLRKYTIEVLTFWLTDAKVDQYYKQEFEKWKEEIENVYKKIRASN
jgi:hypothetical protein